MAETLEIGSPTINKPEYDKVIELLATLSGFGVLTRFLVLQIGHIFSLNTLSICEEQGITYKV